MKRLLVVALFVAALIMVWQAATMSGRWSPVLLPPPRDVALYLWDALRDGTLMDAAGRRISDTPGHATANTFHIGDTAYLVAPSGRWRSGKAGCAAERMRFRGS